MKRLSSRLLPGTLRLSTFFAIVLATIAFSTSAFCNAPKKTIEDKIAQLAIGQEEKTVKNLLGSPAHERKKGTESDWAYDDLFIHFKNSKIQEIRWDLTPPRERSSMIPQDLLLVELPRETSGDTVLPGRRFLDPSSGKLWIIGVRGKVETLIVQAPRKTKELGEPLEKLWEREPPGESMNVRRK